jgi:Cation/multidrug efflux pump
VMELLPQYQRDLSATDPAAPQRPDGAPVPLASLAQITPSTGPLTVNHSGQLPSVTLSFNLEPGVSIGTAVSAVQAAARQVLPSTISTSFAGTAQAFQDAQQGLLVLLVLAILVIYLVLGVLYESFIHPLTILSGLPFAGFGALLALMIFQLDLSIYAFVGIIMLIGIVEKERDHDDRLCHRPGAAGAHHGPEGHPGSSQRPFPSHHDDHHGGAGGNSADCAGPRGRSRVTPAAGHCRGRRAPLLPADHALYHSSGLHLYGRIAAAAGPRQGEAAANVCRGRD